MEAGGRAIAVACDVTSAGDRRCTVEAAVDAFGGLDILFNNAGIIRWTDVIDTTEDEWDRVMAVNVKSVYPMSRYAVPVMAAGGGAIVNTGSGWGLKGAGWHSPVDQATSRRIVAAARTTNSPAIAARMTIASWTPAAVRSWPRIITSRSASTA